MNPRQRPRSLRIERLRRAALRLVFRVVALLTAACSGASVPSFLRDPTGPMLCSSTCPETSGCQGGVCVPLDAERLRPDAGADAK